MIKLKGTEYPAVGVIQINKPDGKRVYRIDCVGPKVARNHIQPSIPVDIRKVDTLPKAAVFVESHRLSCILKNSVAVQENLDYAPLLRHDQIHCSVIVQIP